MMRENEIKGIHGLWMLLTLLVVLALSVTMLVQSIQIVDTQWIIVWLVVIVVASNFLLFGLTIVNPNEAKVIQLSANTRERSSSRGSGG